MPVDKQSLNIIVYLTITTLLSSVFWALVISSGHLRAAGGAADESTVT